MNWRPATIAQSHGESCRRLTSPGNKLFAETVSDDLRRRGSRAYGSCDGRRQRIRDVANRENILNVRLLPRIDHHVSAFIKLQLIAGKSRIRFEADPDDNALHGHLKRLDGARAF